MPQPNLIVRYVRSLAPSVAFYSELFGQKPVQSSPGFAMFALPSGLMFGLWTYDAVKPPAKPSAGADEICLPAADASALETLHSEWRKRGVTIAQAPAELGFGLNFVALDPDGHRLRVIAQAAS